MQPMVAAVILAAGRSARMGRPKALLPHRDGQTTFIAYLLSQLRSPRLSHVLVVGREDDDLLREEAARGDAVFVTNHDPDRGQLSSLVAALDALRDEPDAVLVLPVDVPLVSAGVIDAILGRADAGAAIVRASHRGLHGHPVLFKRSVFSELRQASRSEGAKGVVRSDPARVLDVEVDDPDVLADVDTPQDYERLIGRSLR
jgi:CTP:molybdopterin cytidylyltransferase MocA